MAGCAISSTAGSGSCARRLIEREVLLRMAPHLIRPMRFVLPVEPGMRPRWMLRLGLFVYDHLGGRKLLPATRTIDLARDPLGAPLKGRYEHGFEYSDCWVDDARLVVLNARRRRRARRGDPHPHPLRARRARRRLEAGARGARPARRHDRPRAGQCDRSVGRHVQRNGAAAAAARQHPADRRQPHRGAAAVRSRPRLHLPGAGRARGVRAAVRGRLHAGRHHRPGFFRRSGQGRSRARRRSAISARSRTITSAPRCFRPMWSGRSPACARSTTRTPTGTRSRRTRRATMCWRSTASPARRRCSRSMAARSRPIAAWPRKPTSKLAPLFGARPDWTKGTALPGGDFDVAGIEQLIAGLRLSCPFLSEGHARRLARAYGTRVRHILGSAKSLNDLGPKLRRRPDRRRGPLPDGARMGADRGRRAVAAQQARLADLARRARAARHPS